MFNLDKRSTLIFLMVWSFHLMVNSYTLTDNESAELKQFYNFVSEFGKLYENAAEEMRRFNIFRENLKIIEKLNNNEFDEAEYGITRFADLTTEEFVQQILRSDINQTVSEGTQMVSEGTQTEGPEMIVSRLRRDGTGEGIDAGEVAQIRNKQPKPNIPNSQTDNKARWQGKSVRTRKPDNKVPTSGEGSPTTETKAEVPNSEDTSATPENETNTTENAEKVPNNDGLANKQDKTKAPSKEEESTTPEEKAKVPNQKTPESKASPEVVNNGTKSTIQETKPKVPNYKKQTASSTNREAATREGRPTRESNKVKKTEIIFPPPNTADSFNWVYENPYYPPVEDMGDDDKCGACSLFAIIGALSILYSINQKQPINLSKQQLLDCDRNINCRGQSFSPVFEALKKTFLVPEGDCPYKAKKGNKCNPALAEEGLVTVDTSTAVTTEEQMISELKKGPLAAKIHGQILQHYTKGIMTDCPNLVNSHAITIVGYGVAPGTKSGSPIPYWLLRDYKGSQFGEKGHIFVKRGTCSIEKRVYSVHMQIRPPVSCFAKMCKKIGDKFSRKNKKT